MSKITKVVAREVLDSRGRPTVEVEVYAGNVLGRAIVPSGASTGTAEALELRDRNEVWYDGLGVRQAVRNVNEILGPAILGLDCNDHAEVDARILALDGTPQKSKLGGNALLGVSLAVAQTAAAVQNVPLFRHLNALFAKAIQSHKTSQPIAVPKPRMPLPMVNMISGGLHAGGNLDFQDILVSPAGAPDYRTGLEWIVRTYRRLGELLSHAGYEGRLVGDEGGFGPRLKSNREAVEFVVRAIEAAKLQPGTDMTIAIDVAATHFFDGQTYRLKTEGNQQLSSSEMIDRLESWIQNFPITSIEDGLAEEDWDGWREMTSRLGSKVRLVGDDLFATNPDRLQSGIDRGVANSVLVKVNQIGTLTETMRTMSIAVAAGYARVVSARSGETEDTIIADLAVGSAADQIKIGSIVRSERLAKYNQLLRIEEQLANA